MVIKSNSSRHSQFKNTNGLKNDVIRVPKLYDWVTDSITVTKEVFFEEEQLEAIEFALADPRRRPLRLVAKAIHDHHFFCEQIGDKRDVVVPVGGELVDAQQVEILVNSDIEIQVIDRHGDIVTDAFVDITTLESFVLCFPNGTELVCRLRDVLTEITSGTILLNGVTPHSFTLNVTFCLDIQVEAEVKLEIHTKIASPRENNLEAEESDETSSPEDQFPDQYPDAFSIDNVCESITRGEASGPTDSEFEGTAGVLVDINTSDNRDNSVFEFTFDPINGGTNLVFAAVSFDPDTFHSKHLDNGEKLIVGGTGFLESGHEFDFKVALVESETGDQFQVHLIDPQNGNVLFNTGVVDVNDGDLVITNYDA
jgi:hypothetical protein